MSENDSPQSGWMERNQAHLVREFARLRHRLGEAFEHGEPPLTPFAEDEEPAAIDVLKSKFGLSPFERELVLLCAGVEMDSALAARAADAAGRTQRSGVTFSLALAVLSNPHWSALAPGSPLRRFHLVEMETGHGLTSATLRIDERILHFLAGVNQIDQRLANTLEHARRPRWLAEEHWRLAGELSRRTEPDDDAAVLHLCGDDPSGQEDIAEVVARRFGKTLYLLRHEDTPTLGAEMEQFLQLWTREAMLLPAALLLQWESETPGVAARHLAERLPGGVTIASRDTLRLHREVERRAVDKPEPQGQRRLWEGVLGDLAPKFAKTTARVAEQFRLSAETIVAIATSIKVELEVDGSEAAEREQSYADPDGAEPGETDAEASDAEGSNGESAVAHPDAENGPGKDRDPRAMFGPAGELWRACRAAARPRLETLAERIVPRAEWRDLVLPEMQKRTLRQLAAQSSNRMLVYEDWGFAQRGRRGLGLSALFAGPSGTGKTLAAEVLARHLALDLYRIDLSSVVSKYIGETEKNLKQVFDAAEAGGTLLLFDEADALFGKRSEIKESLDRYANIEVGYLLQRMESFQGLAILTTNLKSSLDRSFQRRLRFTIDFPFPDMAQREAIWARAFPPATPKRGIDPVRLARLNMAGGNIRNIALNAAFLAANSTGEVEMSHILEATRLEAGKVERPLAEAEIRGWV